MREIQSWLDDPSDIATGKKIYNAYCQRYRPSAAIAAQINSFSNSFTTNLLKRELSAILAIVESHKKPIGTTSAKYHTRGSTIDFPEDLKKLDEQIPVLFKQRDVCRYAMRDLEPGIALRDMAYKAVTYDQLIRKYYKALDFYSRTGEYPPDWNEEEAEKTETQKLQFWLRALKAYPRWIARNRNNEEKAAELKEKEEVLTQINTYLKDADLQK